MTDRGSDGSVAALEERGVSGIAASLDNLAREVRDRQKFPWPAIFGFVSVLLVIIGMIGGIVIWSFTGYLNSVNSSFDRQQEQIQSINDGIVPRGEHQERWRSLEGTDANLQRQIDAMRAELGSSFSLNDALGEMGSRISRLEELRLRQTVTPR